MPVRPASHKVINARYKRFSRELVAEVADSTPKQSIRSYLTMTDAEIDIEFWSMCKTSRNILKREAARHRLTQPA